MHMSLNAHFICLIVALVLAVLAAFNVPSKPAFNWGWGSFMFYLLAVFFV